MIAKTSLFSFGCDPDYIRAPVTIKLRETDDEGRPADGIELIDRRNGKTVLRVGTDNMDDYYPTFICEWMPRNLADNASK